MKKNNLKLKVMKKLIRNTGVKCSACEGEINVVYIYKVKSLVPFNKMRVGGENPVSKSVKSVFSCSECGLEFQPTKKNNLKRPDEKVLINIFSNYYTVQLTEELDSKRFYSENKNRKVLSSNLSYVGKYRENSFGLLQEDEGIFLRIFKSKNAELWNLYSELHEKHEKKSSELRKKLQVRLDANQIDDAFKFAKKYNFSLHWSGMNIFKSKKGGGREDNRPKNGTSYTIGTPIGYRSSTFVSTPKVPDNAVSASKVFVLEDNLNLSEYWIPKDCIKKQ